MCPPRMAGIRIKVLAFLIADFECQWFYYVCLSYFLRARSDSDPAKPDRIDRPAPSEFNDLHRKVFVFEARGDEGYCVNS